MRARFGHRLGLYRIGVNSPPDLEPITDQTVPPSQQVTTVTLSASDPDDDPITFTASAQSLVYVLSQQNGQFVYQASYDNWGGQGEKWFQASGQWYFLLGTGELFRWSGSGLTGTSLGLIGTSYYLDPLALQNAAANDPHVTLSITGNTLTVTRDLAWVSAAVITITASDGQGGSDSETFTLFVDPNAATLPAVSVTASDANAAEPADPGTYTITRTGPTTEALTVSFTVGGTASSGSDYTALPTSATIPAGASSVTLTVSPIDDAVQELSETVVLTLSGSGSYTLGSPGAATVSIADNDAPQSTVTVVATQPDTAEGSSLPGVFTLTRSGVNAGKVETVTLRRQTGGGAWSAVRVLRTRPAEHVLDRESTVGWSPAPAEVFPCPKLLP